LFALTAFRRATCATDIPGVVACAQISRFSSSAQNRYFRLLIECERPLNPT
jgi:hypothetical protein